MSDTGVFLTRGGEGLDRRGFTLAEVEKMIDAGILDRDEKFELIDGEIVPMMSPQASPHMQMKGRIARWLGAAAPQSLEVVADATLVLAEKTFLEPDILVYRADKRRRYVRADQALLAVEVVDTSRSRDLSTKAPRYGAAGVPDLWVVEIERTRHLRLPRTRERKLAQSDAGRLRGFARTAVLAGSKHSDLRLRAEVKLSNPSVLLSATAAAARASSASRRNPRSPGRRRRPCSPGLMLRATRPARRARCGRRH